MLTLSRAKVESVEEVTDHYTVRIASKEGFSRIIVTGLRREQAQKFAAAFGRGEELRVMFDAGPIVPQETDADARGDTDAHAFLDHARVQRTTNDGHVLTLKQRLVVMAERTSEYVRGAQDAHVLLDEHNVAGGSLVERIGAYAMAIGVDACREYRLAHEAELEALRSQLQASPGEPLTAVKGRSRVGQWVDTSGCESAFSVYDDRGQQVAWCNQYNSVEPNAALWSWGASVPFGSCQMGAGAASAGEAKDAAMAVLRTWAEVAA